MSEPNRYGVEVEGTGGGWVARILDPTGAAVHERPCRSQWEAETFASTVRQHIRWLSEPTFRRYYRLPEPEGEGPEPEAA